MTPAPELSVVIATYNRAAHLRSTLDALAVQRCGPERFEVVVVVDGATDGTTTLLDQMRTPYALRTVVQRNAGQPAALNVGLDRAAGTTCLFLDDDVTPEPDLVGEHLRAQADGSGVVGIGRLETVPMFPRDPYCRDLAGWMNEHYRELADPACRLTFVDCFSGNLSAPRSALTAVGAFREDLRRSFDVELGYRLVAYGLEPTFLPAARALHRLDKRRPQLVRDAFLRGVADVRIVALHPAAGRALPVSRPNPGRLPTRILRRALLGLRLPPRAVAAAAGAALDARGRRFRGFALDHAYWSGVRHASGDRH